MNNKFDIPLQTEILLNLSCKSIHTEEYSNNVLISGYVIERNDKLVFEASSPHCLSDSFKYSVIGWFNLPDNTEASKYEDLHKTYKE